MASPPSFFLDTLELGPMENFVYLLGDHATHRAAVVDPAWEVHRIVELARRRQVEITDVLLTHSHHDHVNGIGELLGVFDARIHLLKPEAAFWGRELPRPVLHHGGDTIGLGQTSIQILHTPGHTPGSACYRLDRHLITGDTLFVFGCGRCDLRGGDPEAMYRSLKDLAANLPGDTVIHPGHNYSAQPVSTLEEQRAGNPFMHFESLTDFVRYRMVEHDRLRHSPYGPVARPR
jgi:hydroxyacylglutathione hydrolase